MPQPLPTGELAVQALRKSFGAATVLDRAGLPRTERRGPRVAEALALVDLAGSGDRMPASLSGGQARVLVLDEPAFGPGHSVDLRYVGGATVGYPRAAS